MGYESRIFVVDKKEHLFDEDKCWGEIIAMFNMCKYSPVANFMREQPETDCYIYADDGNTKILEDEYDKPLTEASLSDVINILEKELQNGDEYRRTRPLLGMLKSLNEEALKFKNLRVLHYGY